MNPRNILRTTTILLMALVMSACLQQPNVKRMTAVSAMTAADSQVRVPTNSAFVLAPGDELDLTFFYNPELNQEGIVVRPDGKISLPLISSVNAAGKAPDQLESELKAMYSEPLGQLDITLVLKELSPRYVYVDGEVGEAGVVALDFPMTALQAIAFAQGFEDSGRKDSVLLIRRTVEKNIVVKIDLLAALSGTDLSQDIMLQPYDIIFVPKTGVGNVNSWMRQYIRENLPLPLGYAIN